jgi:hypothetical protein
MEKKDYLIFGFVLLALAFRLFTYYKKKKSITAGNNEKSASGKGKLQGQPDDYEPYSK